MTTDELRELAQQVIDAGEKATPGPWEVDSDGELTHENAVLGGIYGIYDFPCVEDEDREALAEEYEANANLIALTREAAPVLARALLEAQTENDRLRAAGDALVDAVTKPTPAGQRVIRRDRAIANWQKGAHSDD